MPTLISSNKRLNERVNRLGLQLNCLGGSLKKLPVDSSLNKSLQSPGSSALSMIRKDLNRSKLSTRSSVSLKDYAANNATMTLQQSHLELFSKGVPATIPKHKSIRANQL